MNQGCKCIKCTNSCTFTPGWFLPDEIKEVAQYLKLSEKELFDKYLGVDWYESSNDIFVLAPAITSMNAGREYPSDPRGQCIFFNNGLCDIHSVKPYECRKSYHDDTDKVAEERHLFVACEWKIKQDFIETLLGYEPESVDFEMFEALSWY